MEVFMLAAGNLHRLTDERKSRYVRAARAEIAMRYDWLARQGGAWLTGKPRKFARGSPQILCRIRLHELEDLYRKRYGMHLPYDDSGIEDLTIAAHHIAHFGGDASAHIIAWGGAWMPDMPRDRLAALAERIIDNPRRYKAATLGWLVRLAEAERTILGITTIRPFNVSDADMKERRMAKARERAARWRRWRPRTKLKTLPLSETRPWQDLGISRATWYRRNPGRRETRRETKPRTQQKGLSKTLLRTQIVSPAREAQAQAIATARALQAAQKKMAIRAAGDHPEACSSLKSPTYSMSPSGVMKSTPAASGPRTFQTRIGTILDQLVLPGPAQRLSWYLRGVNVDLVSLRFLQRDLRLGLRRH
jgi:hypothetical protein